MAHIGYKVWHHIGDRNGWSASRGAAGLMVVKELQTQK